MDQNTRLVLKYLKDKDCIESFLTLQRETGINLISYTKEIQFFKKIILKGDFNQAVTFLSTFENRIEESSFKKIMVDLYKQKLCELIDNPNEEELRTLFEKELMNYCSEQQFQELFNYLTFRSVNQIQEYQKWTVLRGRYTLFENTIPYLQMFNSMVNNQQRGQSLEEILQFYQLSKDGVRESFTFNQKKQPQKVDSYQKNNSNFSSQSYKQIHERQISDQSMKIMRQKMGQSMTKQKQLIKNSIINMDIGSQSQVKSKVLSPANVRTQKSSLNSIEDNESKYHLSQLYPDNKSKQFSESQFQGEKTGKNVSGMQKSGRFKDKSQVVQEKRPRVNASLNSPMNRQKGDNSVKIDNFLKSESMVPNEQSLPNSYKNLKIQKSQLLNNSNISNPSQMMKPNKPQSKRNCSNKYQNPVSYNHYNELQSSQLNQIEQEDHSQATKSVKNERAKYSYLMSKGEDQLEEEVRKNIQYLEQTSSVIYNKEEVESQGYAYQNRKEEERQPFRVNNITQLAATNDPKAIRTCQFSNSGNLFAVGTNSSVLKIFDVQSLFFKNKYQEIVPAYQIEGLHIKSIFCLQWGSNQRSLVTCSNDLNIKLTELVGNFKDHKTSIVGKHDSCIRMVKFSPSEAKIMSCGDDSLIKVWDVGRVNKCINLKGHTNSVTAFKIQNQKELYSVSKDQTIRKWDLRTGQNIATSRIQESELTYIANNIDSIVVSHKNGTVSFFSPDLELIHAIQIHEQEIRSIEGLKEQNTLLTASFDGHVALFNEQSAHEPTYYQHNEKGDDKVVFATFLHSPRFHGFASTSTQGLCHIYSYD